MQVIVLGKIDVILFLKENKGKWYKIRDLARELSISERNIRKHVISLEATNLIQGRCSGTLTKWYREFSYKEDR